MKNATPSVIQINAKHDSMNTNKKTAAKAQPHELPDTPQLLPYISGMSVRLVTDYSRREPLPFSCEFREQSQCFEDPLDMICDTAFDWMTDDEAIDLEGMSISYSYRSVPSAGGGQDTFWLVQLENSRKNVDPQMMEKARLVLLAVTRLRVTDIKSKPQGGNTFVEIEPWRLIKA